MANVIVRGEMTVITHRVVASVEPHTQPSFQAGTFRADARIISVGYRREGFTSRWEVNGISISGPVIKKDGTTGVRKVTLLLDAEGRPYGGGDRVEWAVRFAADNQPPEGVAASDEAELSRYRRR